MGKVRLIDLSVPMEPDMSGSLSPEVQHLKHEEGVTAMMAAFGCAREDLPEGLGWATDIVRLNTHSGTHVDAPWHFHPTSGGKRARTIEQMPLEWFYGDGVVLDMRQKPPGSAISIDDLKQALKKIDYWLKPGDIVLIQTGADQYWGKPEYSTNCSGMARESTLWLIAQGVKVMGTDAWGWDRPFGAIKEEFQRTGNKDILWGAHFAGIEKEYCHIEKLANLDKLPGPHGFKVACFPIKLTGCSAGWSRVVAFVED